MKTKVNIFSPGRFHVCDLARELDKRGFDVKFYSFVPSKRAEKFGLPRHCSCSVLIPMAPFLALERVLFKGCGWAKRLSIRMQDWISYIIMRKCDICICMSGNFIKTPKKAKMQGAIVIMERGSKHVIEQKAVLDAIPNSSNTVPKFNYRRELESYEIADYIAIASQHVLRSFQKHNYPEQKLFINPYGVDLSMFKPMPNVKKEYDVIMVGGWGYRKGCDLIVEALKDTNLTFLHVGGLVDMEFPNLPNFTHVPPVDQSKLVEYYNKAKIFVFPSREDGFGMVLSQAVACNLSIVGSNDCGAPDLKNMVEMPEYIRIIEDYTPQAVLAAINESIKTYDRLDGRVYAGKAVDMLTWEAYGERYSKFINSISGGGVMFACLNWKYDVIMVGGWGYRKGCDLIVEALKDTNLKFLHVGGLVDMEFPNLPNFTHVPPVDQSKLVEYYNKAKIALLPSREEGLAMVQAQAIACNLPLVGSMDSGAEDLKKMVEYPEYITIIEDYTPNKTREAIETSLQLYKQLGNRIYAGDAIKNLTWEAYGKRYADFLIRITSVK